MITQPLSAKLGEVRFRQKLVLQHQGRQIFFPHHTYAGEMVKLLRQRADEIIRAVKKIRREKRLTLSPFLEIGGEKCQRGAALASRLGCQGAVLDLSAESLASAPFFCRKLGLSKLPFRICADAYRLPFSDNSLPFIFTSQTLHHFPDPRPVIREAHRVLAPGGYFYLDGEPVKQLVNLPFWRRDYHLNRWEKILKKILLLPFISQIGASETKAGVIETAFSLQTWQDTLNIFDTVSTELISFPGGKITTLHKQPGAWLSPPVSIRICLALVGGGIRALCRKTGSLPAKIKPLNSFLACPDCRRKIIKTGKDYRCNHCRRFFPVKRGVIYLLPKKLAKKLYPGIQ